MAYTTIPKSSDYFNTKLYTGNGSTNAITGVGFQPDFTWLKNRSVSQNHELYDAVRGVTKAINSNTTSDETTYTNGLNAFGTDGFTVGDSAYINGNGNGIASWNWLANGSGSANTDGDIASTVSANTTSGFSIVSYTGNATAGATVGHGLGVVPKMIIIKIRSGVGGVQWVVYHVSTGNTKACYLNTTTTPVTVTGFFNNTTPSSTVFTLGTDTAVNSSGNPMIAYCFAEKQGYSKFSSYIGNGSTDGTFIYTGFKPAFFLAKRITDGTEPWVMFDNKRANPFNGVTGILKPNLSEAETTQGAGPSMDFLSNGIKFRNTDGTFNNSGIEFIYMAFAEQPLVGDNPATAR
jgi:hypothetical protein